MKLDATGRSGQVIYLKLERKIYISIFIVNHTIKYSYGHIFDAETMSINMS
jgi:hypothetical protein